MTFVTGNETDSPPTPPPESVPQRKMFHVALAFVFIPFISLFVTGAMAAGAINASTPLQKKWKRYVLGLLVVDVLVAACFLWVIVHQGFGETTTGFKGPVGIRGRSKPRLGITGDPDSGEIGARVVTVLPGSPAERAGLQPKDLVEQIDGNRVDTWL